jgi:hypothetical protein
MSLLCLLDKCENSSLPVVLFATFWAELWLSCADWELLVDFEVYVMFWTLLEGFLCEFWNILDVESLDWVKCKFWGKVWRSSCLARCLAHQFVKICDLFSIFHGMIFKTPKNSQKWYKSNSPSSNHLLFDFMSIFDLFNTHKPLSSPLTTVHSLSYPPIFLLSIHWVSVS